MPCALSAFLTGRARPRRADAGFTQLAGRTTMPILPLVPQVTLKKRVDVDGAARQWAARLPELIRLAWPD